jgi:hypothetical protein
MHVYPSQKNCPDDWPSESHNGAIVAEGPGISTLGNPVVFGNLYVMDPTGKTAHQIATPADVESCLSLPALNVRISPDGQRIAYYERTCATDATWWTPTSSTNLNYPGQTLGQQTLDDPVWMDNSRLLLSDVAEPFLAGQQEFNVYTVGGGDDSYAAWFSDTDGGIMSGGWAYGFNATISRQGTRVAVVETDGNLTPQRVELHLFTTTGAVPAAPTFNCAHGAVLERGGATQGSTAAATTAVGPRAQQAARARRHPAQGTHERDGLLRRLGRRQDHAHTLRGRARVQARLPLRGSQGQGQARRQALHDARQEGVVHPRRCGRRQHRHLPGRRSARTEGRSPLSAGAGQPRREQDEQDRDHIVQGRLAVTS